ncbi:MAG TPA: PQQ-dependent sugar dehydrogenase, partial [Lacipirellula sp.]
QAFRPESTPVTQELIDQLDLPDGFRINIFAKDLGHARMLEVGDDGTVYLTAPKQGKVIALRDTDRDGVADQTRTLVEDLKDVHGIVLHEGRMYLAQPTQVSVAPLEAWDRLGEPRVLLRDLPDGGQHPNRTLAVRDGKLFITVGSSCNACPETNPEHATILVAPLPPAPPPAPNAGGERRIFARGLRNTLGFGWHPRTGQMWGMDHGSDGRGNDIPPEELNRLEEGNHYGWPYVYGKQQPDPIIDDPPGTTKRAFAQKTAPAIVTYQAHSAPIGMAFYDAQQFPAKYRGGAFVAFRGSWNRIPATGYKVAFIPFNEQGAPGKFQDFVSGFLLEDGKRQFARLAGMAVAKDGSLLFTDDSQGVIYRVSYQAGKGQ